MTLNKLTDFTQVLCVVFL